MNLLLLIALLSITLFVVLPSNDYDLLSPGALYCIVFIMGAAGLLLLGEGITIKLNTVGVIWACSIAFALGDMLAVAIRAKRGRTSDYGCDEFEAEGPQASVIDIRLTIALCLLMVTATIYTAYDLGVSATSSNYLAEGAVLSHGVEKSTLSSLLNGLTSAIAYAFLAIVLFRYLYRNVISWDCIAVILLYLPIPIITGSRIQILFFVVVAVHIFYVLLGRKLGHRKDSCFRFLKISSVVFVLMLIAFYLLGMLTGKSQSFRLADIVLVYLGAPLSGLDQCINGYFEQVASQGLFSFAEISNVLQLFGIENGKAVFGYAVGGSSYGYYAILPQHGLYGNVYTGLFNWLHDVGLVGTMLVCLAISFVFSLIRLYVMQFKIGSIAALTCFTVYYIPMFFMSIDDLFDSDLTYKKFLVGVAAFLVVRAYEKGKFDWRRKSKKKPISTRLGSGIGALSND